VLGRLLEERYILGLLTPAQHPLKLYNRFGPIKDRDNTRLLQSIDAISGVIEELRKMLSKNVSVRRAPSVGAPIEE
jgi:hypothetical protein